jgi:hypothetical protein
MLGPAKSRRLDAPIAVSLEQIVPADHFYRHVEATLDWWRVIKVRRGLRCAIAWNGGTFTEVPHMSRREAAPDERRKRHLPLLDAIHIEGAVPDAHINRRDVWACLITWQCGN